MLKLEEKLLNTEKQINDIVKIYDNLSLGKLDFEEKWIFANILINLYELVDKKANIIKTFNLELNEEPLLYSIELMKSSDIEDKTIGIDMFMSIAHTNEHILPDLVAISNNVDYEYGKGYALNDYDDIEIFFDWRSKIGDKIVKKLNEIRNRKGLSKIIFGY